MAACGDATHGGNFWVWNDEIHDELLEAWWETIENQNAVYAGASKIEGGAMVSMLGHRAHDLQNLTQELLRATRHKFSGIYP